MNFESKNDYRFVAYVIFVFFTVPGMDVKEKALFVCAAFMLVSYWNKMKLV
jgi:hypothetical protein